MAAFVALTATGLGACSGTAPDAAPAGGETGPGTPATPRSAPATLALVVAAVEDRVAVYDGIATGVIALVRVGDETHVTTGGLAEVDPERPMRVDETFPIASITKPMTATVVLQLVDEGRIELDDDVRGLLPALEGLDTPITVEQVLSHRSGLVRDARNSDIRRYGLGNTAALVAAAARRGLEYEPGSDGRYSNLGYGALGLLVEEVLDQPLARALEKRVFGPAAMTSSSLGDAPEVQGYADSEPVRNYHLEFVPGAGSVVSTVTDLDAFFHALWAGDLLPEDRVADMRESRGQVQVGIGFRPDYGLGLIRWTVRCGTAIGHSGRIGGFTIESWTLTDASRATTVVVNDQDADQVARGIVETALCGG